MTELCPLILKKKGEFFSFCAINVERNIYYKVEFAHTGFYPKIQVKTIFGQGLMILTELCPLSLREKTIIKLPVNMAFELLAVCGGICSVSTHQIQYIYKSAYQQYMSRYIQHFCFCIKVEESETTQCKEKVC